MQNNNVLKKSAAALALFVFVTMLLASTFSAFAASTTNYMAEVNPESGYAAILVDPANLLNEQEETEVFDKLKELSSEAVAIFAATESSHKGDIVEYAKTTLENICATTGQDGYQAVIFMVDMYYRELVVYSGEKLAGTLTRAIANSITDNVYRYAGDGKFKECAVSAFSQIQRVLDGQKIAQPMRFISAGLFALFTGLLIAMLIVRAKTKRKETPAASILDSLAVKKVTPTITMNLIDEKKIPHVEFHSNSFSSGTSFGSSYHSSYGGSHHSSFGGSSHSSFGGSSRSSFGGSSRSSFGGSGRSSGSSGRGAGGSHRF